KMLKFVLLLSFVAVALAEPSIYFKDYFAKNDWEKRWLTSESKDDFGKFKLTAGKFYNDEEQDAGLQTTQDARFYAVSSSFDSFSNKGKTLVVQFSVKHEQNIDCGGGYVKLFPGTLNQKKMTGDSEYNIMFGPDICGPGTKKVHVIFQYKGKNLLIKKDIRCKDDEATHVYTLIVKPDNTYEVLIDNTVAQTGGLEADWDFLPAKEIKDPEASKPEDWDDREKIPDPTDTKPEDWEKPEHIADPDAKKPEDWDDEMDGEWEAPMVDNPEYKGEWEPKQIDNPDYSGKWVHPMIPNPEYVADDELYAYDDFGVIGLDLWQVKSGTIFDNFLMTDDADFAKSECENILSTTVKGEKKMKDAHDEEERKKREEEEKKTAEETDEEDADADADELDEDEEDATDMDEDSTEADETEDAIEQESAGKDEL
uniref:Calreticulin n=2 Tax=Ciona intestinalis TaxID=7719 RepID=F6Z781_CIOIN